MIRKVVARNTSSLKTGSGALGAASANRAQAGGIGGARAVQAKSKGINANALRKRVAVRRKLGG